MSILRRHEEHEGTHEEILPCCPVCGKKAFLSHDIVDGFDMGYGAGCPAYCHYDGVHGTTFDTRDDDCFKCLGFFKKDDAIDWWVKRVKRYKDEHPGV